MRVCLFICLCIIGCVTFGAQEFVRYKKFGAKGDGKSDDMEAIIAAHEYANSMGLPVKAEDGAVYYIGQNSKEAIIRTDTDFGDATFILDDTKVSLEKRGIGIFRIVPDEEQFNPGIKAPVKIGQKNIGGKFKCKTMLIIHNNNVKHFIRKGLNQNNGAKETDLFIVDEEGNIDKSTPVTWNFDEITEQMAIPLSTKPITVKGGHFITRANSAESKYTYYNRGITISRSNVTIKGIRHDVEGEGDHGAPYNGFFSVLRCANVTLKNVIVTGHKTYNTVGSAGKPVSMGTYDLGCTYAINVSFINMKQTNDIKDTRYWGVLGTNYCRNLLYDNCELSRFDAHCGTYNATIRNSKMGHQGVSLIGYGTFLIENTTVYGNNFISLRGDYGSFWRGKIAIINCTLESTNGRRISIISGSNQEDHDFGYECVMPQRILIDGMTINDSKCSEAPCIFNEYNSGAKDGYKPKFPVVHPKSLKIKGIKTASGKKPVIFANPFFFKGTKLITE